MHQTLQEFFAALPPSSGSPRGLSYYSRIEACPEQAARMAEPGAPVVEVRSQATRGVLFHALWQHEWDLTLPTGELTEVQLEALRLYAAYREYWVSPEQRFGCELTFSEIEFAAPDGRLTGRVDRLLRVVDPERLKRYGVLLPAGAYLIHDFKSADARKPASYYLRGMQARFYPLLWNADASRPHVSGMLFDECLAHATIRREAEGPRKPASYNVFWAPEAIDPSQMWTALQTWTTQKEQQLETRYRNFSNCVSVHGDECPFYNDCHGGL